MSSSMTPIVSQTRGTSFTFDSLTLQPIQPARDPIPLDSDGATPRAGNSMRVMFTERAAPAQQQLIRL